MKKITKTFLLLAIMLFAGVGLIACNGQSDEMKAAIDSLKVETLLTGEDTKDDVKLDLKLPTGHEQVAITWKSDNPEVINNNGEVTLPLEEDVTVTLTAELTFEKEKEEVKFKFTVKKYEAPESATHETSVSVEAFTNMSGDTSINQAELIGLPENIFFVTGDSLKTEWANTIGLAVDGAIRLYGDRASGDGNTLSISALEGYVITDVTFNFGDGNNGPTKAEIKLGDEIQDLGTEPVMNNTISYEDISVNSVSVKNNNKDEKVTHQVWLSSIVITYKKVK